MPKQFIFRLVAPTLFVGIVLFALGGAAAWYVHDLQRDSATVLSTNITRVTAAEELVIVSHELRHELGLFLATNDAKYLRAALKRREDAETRIARCDELAGSDVEQQGIRQIREGYERFYSQLVPLNGPNPPANAREEALNLLRNRIEPEILAPVKSYYGLIGKERERATTNAQVLADRMGMGLLVLGACGAVAGILSGFGLARGIHRSIVQLSVPIHDAAGKLDKVVGPVRISAVDLDELETTMQQIAQRVGTVLEQLQESQAVARRAEQLASLGQLAAGIAHELRNPLTSMKIIVQTAVDQGGAVAGSARPRGIK